ncbi:hypothetical protein K7711_36665 [Nocardia sp. CA2R105]|uniref:hypothetical protein n=1 Tax=Nocardia coffeae TaxID=2873381 RepID=UPI001CA618C8|nr:hypothetical protein [Nocardia coffeae]MBY8862058.1 hypothetical protein [Nocardia coffeae]
MQLSVTNTEGEPEPVPPVDAFIWDSARWMLLSQGAGGGAVVPAGYPRLHAAWFLARIIECEDRDTLIAAALNPLPGTTWKGHMQVLTTDDTPSRVYAHFRYHSPQRLSGLLLQVERYHAPVLLPPTHHRDAAAELLGATTALIDIERMQIVEWLTPPLSGIAWPYHPTAHGPAPTDPDGNSSQTAPLIHPDDLATTLRNMHDLATGHVTANRTVARLLTVEGHWQSVELHHTHLPHGSSRFIAVLIRPLPTQPQFDHQLR